MQVYEELSRVPHLLMRVDVMKKRGDLTVESMEVGSIEYEDYIRMTMMPEKGERIIGRGEAAGIAMAKERGGTLASNNLRDISEYVKRYGLRHITTGDILIQALNAGLISKMEGNSIWKEMLRRRRRLPTATFTDYIRNSM